MAVFIDRPRRIFRIAASIAIALAPLSVHAQVQRSFLNASFEQPALQTPGCRVYIADAQVPGYATTHPAQLTENVGNCVVPAGFAQTAPIMELWRTPRDNASGGPVNAPDGVQIAELNAAQAARIFQNVCLISGERIAWRFNHRGRGSATVHDQAELKLGASTTVVRIGTTNTGAFLAPVASQGTANAPTNPAGNPTWAEYTGAFTNPGVTGVTSLGFEAIGGSTSGNLLDNIQIQLAPFVEFVQASSTTPESASNNLPTLRVNGTAFAPFTVTVRITGGTATLGTDYTTPGGSTTLTVSVPAGVYNGSSAGSLFPLPISVVNDTAIESSESIELAIDAPPAASPPFLLASSVTCGGPAQRLRTYTIADDDTALTVVKNAAEPVPVAGNPAQADIDFTITVGNSASTLPANYSLVDSPAFDPDAAIISARYTLNGGAPVALAGAGPWTLQPQWRALAAGATDTYVVTVRVAMARGGGTGNDACSGAAGSGLYNLARATLQGSGGTGNSVFEDTECSPTPTPAWVLLRKQLPGRAVATDQVQVRIFAGGVPAASATTTGSTVPATAATALTVLPAGTAVQFEEAVKANGTGPDTALTNYVPQIACSSTGTATPGLPSGAGSDLGNRQQWPEFALPSGADIDCTITNTPRSADLSISKTNNTTTVVRGTQTTYAITVDNAGPNPADGALLRDPAPTGLTGCVLGSPACTASGSAVCPTTGTGAGQLSIANLQGAGVVIPTLPNGGRVVVQVTCTVQ